MTLALALAIAQMPAVEEPKEIFTRDLSVYGDQFNGGTTKGGDKFHQNADLVASNDWPIGTKVRITFNGKSAVLPIRDTMAKRFSGKRIDLPRKWFKYFQDKPDGLHKGAVVEVVR